MKFKILFVIMLFCMVASANVGSSADTTIVLPSPTPFPSGGTVWDILSWLPNAVIDFTGILFWVLMGIEALLSFIPTAKNLSWLVALRRFLDKVGDFALIFSNRKLGGGKFKL